jgi:hypothetical protein
MASHHPVRFSVDPPAERMVTDLGWHAPTQPADAATTRRAILWQHDRIRDFLAKASRIAELALDHKLDSSETVASTIGDLRAVMEVHLAFEEKVLLPLLLDDLPVGRRRADRLLYEHQRHREMLAMLHREACAYPELPTLAAKLAFLTSWLLADMVEEERGLMIPDVAGDDRAPIDHAHSPSEAPNLEPVSNQADHRRRL